MTTETSGETPPPAIAGSRLIIFTGPPGAGKLVLMARSPFRHLPVFCCYYYNKRYWRGYNGDAVLFAYSPARQAKEYWLNEAEKEGRSPTLYTVMTDRDTAMQRMLCRPTNNKLQKEVNDWFKHYKPHPNERIIKGPPFDARREQGIYGSTDNSSGEGGQGGQRSVQEDGQAT